MITLQINGERRSVGDGSSLADAVAATGVDPGQRGLAAAVDGEVVPRDRWRDVGLREGQRVEVVQAIQGG